MITFAKVVGKSATWAWNNKSTIMAWIRNGWTITSIVNEIRRRVR